MSEQHKKADLQISGLPIREDSAVEVAINPHTKRPEIVSVKPIYRPPEKESEPVKSYWVWIWLTVIALVVLAWLFFYSYFSNHQAPYSAPLRQSAVTMMNGSRNHIWPPAELDQIVSTGGY